MNTFERFDAVLKHKKTDKTPFYFPTISCSVASEILGREVPTGGDSLHFKEELSLLNGKTAHDEFIQEHHEATIEINSKLKADIVRETWRSSETPVRKIDDFTLLFETDDGGRKVKRFFPDSQSYGVIEDNTKPGSVEELKERLAEEMRKGIVNTYPNEIYKDQLFLKKMAEPYFPAIFNAACPFISIDDPVWLMASSLEPELVSEYLIFRTEIYIQHLKWAAKMGYKFILGGSDVASNSGAILAPESFKTIMLEPLKMISKVCKENNMTYCYRSDGNMWELMDIIFSKADIDAFGEVDRDAGMTVKALKNEYPDLIILGNISSAILHQGSIVQVEKHVKAGLEESGGLNYISGPSNMIMHGTPVDNVWTMVDEISKYGKNKSLV